MKKIDVVEVCLDCGHDASEHIYIEKKKRWSCNDLDDRDGCICFCFGENLETTKQYRRVKIKDPYERKL